MIYRYILVIPEKTRFVQSKPAMRFRVITASSIGNDFEVRMNRGIRNSFTVTVGTEFTLATAVQSRPQPGSFYRRKIRDC